MSVVSVTAPATADTEFSVAHGLLEGSFAKVPSDGFVVQRNRGANLYRSGTAWTSSLAYLKSDTANAMFVVAFF